MALKNLSRNGRIWKEVSVILACVRSWRCSYGMSRRLAHPDHRSLFRLTPRQVGHDNCAHVSNRASFAVLLVGETERVR